MASTQNADAIGPVKSRDIELGRELGNRPVPTHIARLQRPNAEPDLIIATRIDRAGPMSVDEAMDLSRVARLLSRNPHPNLTRVRDVVVRDTDMLLLEDFLDGQSLGEMWRTARGKGSPLPLAVSLRIILDVLSGLEALHSVRLAAGQPAGLVHGELTPGNVIVGQDGISRLIHTCRVATAWSSVPEAPRYVAPEILMHERELDARVDLYSVGALIWEAITGKPAIEATSAAAVVKYLARGPLPSPAIPRNAQWAEPVSLIAMRALSPDRDARYDSAGVMRDELLKEIRSRVAPPEDVARWIRQLAGTVIQERRKRFASEAQARLSIDVELSSPGMPLPDRSASKSQEAIKTTPAPPLESAPAMARRPPPPPAIATKPSGPVPDLAPPREVAVASVSEPFAVSPSARKQPDAASPFDLSPSARTQQAAAEPVAASAHEAAGQPLPVAPALPLPIALAPAMTPPVMESAGVAEPPVSETSQRKGKRKIAWIAAGICIVAGVVIGTWLGLRVIKGSEPEPTAATSTQSMPAAATAQPQAASTVAAEPPSTARPSDSNATEEPNVGGATAGAEAAPVARTGPAGAASPNATGAAASEPSQAAPAATPDPIPGPPPRQNTPAPEPRKTKGKYQPLGI